MRSMSEILFLCGRSERAVIVSLNILNGDFVKSANRTEDEVHFIIFNKLHVISFRVFVPAGTTSIISH